MNFSDIVGNEFAKKVLRNTLETGRVGHAYVFEGPKGTGRMSLAKIFGANLLGTDKAESHPDFLIINNQRYNPEKTQKKILIDTIRNMKKDAYIRPYSAERKVYVLPYADTMEATAQNSLLKLLEEPPEYCTIILMAENSSLFLPTILSRAVIVKTHLLKIVEVEKYLIFQEKMEPEKAEKLAAISGGSIGRALEMADADNYFALRNQLLQKLFELEDGTYRDLYGLIGFITSNSSEHDFIFDILETWAKDIISYKYGKTETAVVNRDMRQEYERLSAKISKDAAVRFSDITQRYRRLINTTNRNITGITKNTNYSVAIQCMVTEYWEEIHGRNHWN